MATAPVDISSVMASIEARIQAQREAQIADQRSKILQAGGTAAFLSTVHPSLTAVIPSTTPPELLARVPRWDLEHWDGRLRACADCREGEGCGLPGIVVLDDGLHGQKPVGFDPEHAAILTEQCVLWGEMVLRHKLRAAGVGKRFFGCRFSNYRPATRSQREALAACQDYAARFEETPDPGLLLSGPAGTGKTHLAIAVAADLIGRGRDVQVAVVPRLLTAIRESFGRDDAEASERLLRQARTADLLIMDDLGAERVTDWVREQLFLLINARYEEERAVLVTTNDTPEDLEDQVGPRIVSRLMEMTQGVAVDGPDHRKRRVDGHGRA